MSLTGVTKAVNPPQLAAEISRMYPSIFRIQSQPSGAILVGNSVGVGSSPYVNNGTSFLQPASNPTIMQDTSSTFVNIGTGIGNQGAGQSFTGDGSIIGAYDLHTTALVGTPTDSLLVEILSGSMTGTVIATTTPILASSLVIGGYTRFTFPQIVVSNGATYYVRITRTGALDSSNYVNLSCSSTDVYAGGTRWSMASGVWSSAPATDLRFRLVSTTPSNYIASGPKELSWKARLRFPLDQNVFWVQVNSTQFGEGDVSKIPHIKSVTNIYDAITNMLVATGVDHPLSNDSTSYTNVTDEFNISTNIKANLLVEIAMTNLVEPVEYFSALYNLWVEGLKLPNVVWDSPSGTLTCTDINDQQLAQALMYHQAFFPGQQIPDEVILDLAPEKLNTGILAAGNKIVAPQVIVGNELKWRLELKGTGYILRYWDGNTTRFTADDIGNLYVTGNFTASSLDVGQYFHVGSDGSLGIGGKSSTQGLFMVGAAGNAYVANSITIYGPPSVGDGVTMTYSGNHSQKQISMGNSQGIIFNDSSGKSWMEIGYYNDVGYMYLTDQSYQLQIWPPFDFDVDNRPFRSGSILFGSANQGGGGGIHPMVKDYTGWRYNLTDGAVLARLTTQFSVASFTAEQTILSVTLPAGWLGEDMYIEGLLEGLVGSVAGTAVYVFRWYLGANQADAYNFSPGTGTGGFYMHNSITIRDAGSVTGTMVGATIARGGAAAAAFVTSAPTTAVVNTTIANTLKVTVSCNAANASNSIAVDLGYFRLVTSGS